MFKKKENNLFKQLLIKNIFFRYFLKITKNIMVIFLAFLMLYSCRFPDNFGFFQPITMDLKVPDGPPEFKAGWHNGCKSALGMRTFANSYVYQHNRTADFGNGVYQHDQTYNSAWSNAFFVCATYAGTFVSNNSLKFAPLQ